MERYGQAAVGSVSAPKMAEFRTKQRVQALRLLAEECRAIAESLSTEEARAQMLRFAESYEKMALAVEEIEEHMREVAAT